jgi:hypothetical protein
MDKPWDWERLNVNPIIGWEFVHANRYKPWRNVYELIVNPMKKDKEQIVEQLVRKELQNVFKKSALKQELMERMFHPKNIESWGFDNEDN